MWPLQLPFAFTVVIMSVASLSAVLLARTSFIAVAPLVASVTPAFAAFTGAAAFITSFIIAIIIHIITPTPLTTPRCLLLAGLLRAGVIPDCHSHLRLSWALSCSGVSSSFPALLNSSWRVLVSSLLLTASTLIVAIAGHAQIVLSYRVRGGRRLQVL